MAQEFIHKSLYDNVKNKMLEKLKALKPANPELTETRFGSLTSKEHFNKVKHYENMAKEDSSITVHQYESQMKEGNFISPMLLENVEFIIPSTRMKFLAQLHHYRLMKMKMSLQHLLTVHNMDCAQAFSQKTESKQQGLLQKLRQELCG